MLEAKYLEVQNITNSWKSKTHIDLKCTAITKTAKAMQMLNTLYLP